jgi:hypothetical protein
MNSGLDFPRRKEVILDFSKAGSAWKIIRRFLVKIRYG